MRLRLVWAALVCVALARPAAAQQRPLVTQDPETIGAGHMLVDGGISYSDGITYPATGLKGNMWQIPVIGLVFGVSSIADLQITGGPYDSLSITQRFDAPLSDEVNVTGDSTHSVDDIVIATKIRFLSEAPNRPSMGIRFATELPNSKPASGMGLSTINFFTSVLVGKTIQSVRVVGNIGLGILPEPTDAIKQNDVLTYGVSFARALTSQAEVVGEVAGRVSTRAGEPPPGTESRAIIKFGGRYTQGPVRFDAAVFFGMTSIDPNVGFMGGVTYVFNAFSIP